MVLREILKKLKEGEISVENAEKLMQIALLSNLQKSLAPITTNFKIPEIIYGAEKSEDILVELINTHLKYRDFVIISRATKDQIETIKKEFKKYLIDIYALTGIVVIRKAKREKQVKFNGKVAILTSGTSEIVVAEEARIICEELGCTTITNYDISMHEILSLYDLLRHLIAENVKVFIVVSGKDGTLPVIMSYLVDLPIIGVPFSSKPSTSESGIGSLVTMLQSNAPGLAIVNLNNGVNAALLAATILGLVKTNE
ncbi:MAG: hypothetical protein DRO67_06815 [Candidatus Asgardarchaeum californiense]|nr:MAG: hypothetical protein DRO67_06815 [Candidatus Asgardarchaeum californiense]